MNSLRCGIWLYMTCIDNWIDPPDVVTLDIISNITTPLRVGQTIEFVCTAHNQREESTLEWQRVLGPTETREQAGRSPLVHTRVLTAADHGTEFYCGTWFFRKVGDTSMFYYAKSDRIAVQLEGITEIATPPNTGGEKIWVNANPQASSYKVGDVVAWVCDAENIKHGLVEMRQGKDRLEKKLYTGYQLGYRWLPQNLTIAENGSYVYCVMSIYDSDKGLTYNLNGPRYNIKLN